VARLGPPPRRAAPTTARASAIVRHHVRAQQAIARRGQERARRRVRVGDHTGLGVHGEEGVTDAIDRGRDRAALTGDRCSARAACAPGVAQGEHEALQQGAERRTHGGLVGSGHLGRCIQPGLHQSPRTPLPRAQSLEGRCRPFALGEGEQQEGAKTPQRLGLRCAAPRSRGTEPIPELPLDRGTPRQEPAGECAPPLHGRESPPSAGGSQPQGAAVRYVPSWPTMLFPPRSAA
jgi:hypothetical protein